MEEGEELQEAGEVEAEEVGAAAALAWQCLSLLLMNGLKRGVSVLKKEEKKDNFKHGCLFFICKQFVCYRYMHTVDGFVLWLVYQFIEFIHSFTEPSARLASC